ncbi:MAG: hypothetical protein SGPRY_007838, partial [Prymnesium sp.]
MSAMRATKKPQLSEKLESVRSWGISHENSGAPLSVQIEQTPGKATTPVLETAWQHP